MAESARVSPAASVGTLMTPFAVPVARPRPRGWVLLLLLALLLAVFLGSLLVGSVTIPLHDTLSILLGAEAPRASWHTIVMQFRLPKALTAMLAGSALAASGLMMQTLFRNPLADPFILGVSSGASLGAAVVVLAAGGIGGALMAQLGLAGDAALIAAASAGAALAMVLVLLIARRIHSIAALLILGVMSGYVTSSLVSILTQFATREQIQNYAAWSFGSFGGVTWDQMPVFAAALLMGAALMVPVAKPLNALLLGEAYARSMGVDVRRVRLLVVGSAALQAGAVTAFCGPIAFLGMAVPHLCRALIRTHDHRILLPACALLGATLALAADIIAQVPGQQWVLPLNAIMALFGAPIVISVLLRYMGGSRQ